MIARYIRNVWWVLAVAVLLCAVGGYRIAKRCISPLREIIENFGTIGATTAGAIGGTLPMGTFGGGSALISRCGTAGGEPSEIPGSTLGSFFEETTIVVSWGSTASAGMGITPVTGTGTCIATGVGGGPGTGGVGVGLGVTLAFFPEPWTETVTSVAFIPW